MNNWLFSISCAVIADIELLTTTLHFIVLPQPSRITSCFAVTHVHCFWLIFHLLFTFPATWCAAVWNLDMRSWKQTVPSAGEVDQRLPMWVEMFASLAACCRQPVVVTSVPRISEKFNNEHGITWHSPLTVGLIRPADICSFISNE